MSERQLKLYNNFLIKSIKVHGGKYDYSKVKYTTNKTKVEIYCTIHDHTFWVEPKRHYNENRGCEICSGYKTNTKIFIEDCIRIHGDKYNYDDVVYVNKYSKIVIYCNKCKDAFTQQAQQHRYFKQGCPVCYINRLYNGSVKNKSDFGLYKHIVEKITDKVYRKYKNIINPNNFDRSRTGYHLDHKFSIAEGFKNNIPPYIISDISNLEVIRYNDNIRKSKSCSVSIEELFNNLKIK